MLYIDYKIDIFIISCIDSMMVISMDYEAKNQVSRTFTSKIP